MRSTVVRLSVLAFVVSILTSCSGGGSPVAPSPTASAPAAPAATTRVINVSGSLAFGDVRVGSSSTLSITVSNTGNASLTLSAVTAPTGGGAINATLPPAIAAGSSANVTVQFTPQTVTAYSGTISIASDATSGSNTITFSGNGAAAPQTLFSLAGVLTEPGRGAVSSATVTISGGTYNGRSTVTDGNGYFSFGSISGSITLVVTKTGFDTTTRTVTVTGDTRVDLFIAAVVVVSTPTNPTNPTTPTTPTVPSGTRIGATCRDGSSSDATGSGACSSHGGVQCWRYSDGSCRAS